MYLMIRQNSDLCEVCGYVYGSIQEALDSASKCMGLDVRAVPAEVAVENGPTFHCHVAVPVNGSRGPCREGQMTLIAQANYAADIAIRLCRRNLIYGCGKLLIKFPRSIRT
jgi:hypothetical protein